MFEHSRQVNFSKTRFLYDDGYGGDEELATFSLHPTKKDTKKDGIVAYYNIPIYYFRNYRGISVNVKMTDSTNTIKGKVTLTNNLPDSGWKTPPATICNDETWGPIDYTNRGNKEISMSFGVVSSGSPVSVAINSGLTNGYNETKSQNFIFNEYLWDDEPDKDYLILTMVINMTSSSKWNASQYLECTIKFLR